MSLSDNEDSINSTYSCEEGDFSSIESVINLPIRKITKPTDVIHIVDNMTGADIQTHNTSKEIIHLRGNTVIFVEEDVDEPTSFNAEYAKKTPDSALRV